MIKLVFFTAYFLSSLVLPSSATAEDIYAYIKYENDDNETAFHAYNIKDNVFYPRSDEISCSNTGTYSLGTGGNSGNIFFYCNNIKNSWVNVARIDVNRNFLWLGEKVFTGNSDGPKHNSVRSISGLATPVITNNWGDINYSIGVPIFENNGSIRNITYSSLGIKWFAEKILFIGEYNLFLRAGAFSPRPMYTKRKYELLQLLPDKTLFKLASYDDPIEYWGLSLDSGRKPIITVTDISWLNDVQKINIEYLHKRYNRNFPNNYQHYKAVFSLTRGSWDASSRPITEQDYNTAPDELEGAQYANTHIWIDDDGETYIIRSDDTQRTLSLIRRSDQKSIRTWSYMANWSKVETASTFIGFNKITLDN